MPYDSNPSVFSGSFCLGAKLKPKRDLSVLLLYNAGADVGLRAYRGLERADDTLACEPCGLAVAARRVA